MIVEHRRLWLARGAEQAVAPSAAFGGCGETLGQPRNLNPARALLRQVMSRTGALRQFISKATRLKLPGGLLTTGRARQRGTHTKITASARMQGNDCGDASQVVGWYLERIKKKARHLPGFRAAVIAHS